MIEEDALESALPGLGVEPIGLAGELGAMEPEPAITGCSLPAVIVTAPQDGIGLFREWP